MTHHAAERGRPPAFVSRETGSRELDISPDTWDKMVRGGRLPQPVKIGSKGSTPRWRWADVERTICGTAPEPVESDPFLEGVKNVQKKGRDRAAA